MPGRISILWSLALSAVIKIYINRNEIFAILPDEKPEEEEEKKIKNKKKSKWYIVAVFFANSCILGCMLFDIKACNFETR